MSEKNKSDLDSIFSQDTDDTKEAFFIPEDPPAASSDAIARQLLSGVNLDIEHSVPPPIPKGPGKEEKLYQNTCEFCGVVFQAKRQWSKYHSSDCKAKAHWKKRLIEEGHVVDAKDCRCDRRKRQNSEGTEEET